MFALFKGQDGVLGRFWYFWHGLQDVSFTFFSLLPLTAAMQHFLPFLKYVLIEVPPAELIGPALGSSRFVLELSGMGSVMEIPWCLLPKATSCYQNIAALPSMPV